MRTAAFATLGAFALGSTFSIAAPFPLEDGFPTPSTEQVGAIVKAAGGAPPNSPLPTKLSAGAAAALQLIALNEAFEVAFFTSLLNNVTTGVEGFTVDASTQDFVVQALTAIQKQEELHYLGANGILSSAGETTIEPCQYQFPTTTFQSAIAFANTFTDVVLSVLPQAQTAFGSDGGDETGLVQLVGSVIGQEGEQNGWYRSLQQKVPSAAPFLTAQSPAFAFSLLQQAVIVEGSCPQLSTISAAIPTFKPLTVVGGTGASDSTAQFSVASEVSADQWSMVYMSGQNVPYVTSIESVSTSNGVTSFSASFPFASQNFANGLTVAALINCVGVQFANVSAVVSSGYTIFGPGIIEIN